MYNYEKSEHTEIKINKSSTHYRSLNSFDRDEGTLTGIFQILKDLLLLLHCQLEVQ